MSWRLLSFLRQKYWEVLDLGTGSGAVAIAISKQRPKANVTAIDQSDEALAVARDNAQRLGAANLRFMQGDWCAPLDKGARFDVIAGNPPYIAECDAHLAQGDLRFEPKAALASGADGLDAIRAIASQAAQHMTPTGWLLLEHGFEQGAACRKILAEHGFAGDLQPSRPSQARTGDHRPPSRYPALIMGCREILHS